MLPPWSMWVHVASPDRRDFRMWLPLFLVWLILLPIVLLAFVISVVVDVALFVTGHSYHHYTLLLLRCLGLIADTRGMAIRVHGDRSIVDVTVQ